MPSFIRRILGKHDPDPHRGWEGPIHVCCMAPRATRTHDQHFVSEETHQDHDGRLYVHHGLTPIHLLGEMSDILVSQELGKVLAKSCPDDLELVPVNLLDIATGKREQITREEILESHFLVPRLWRYEAGRRHLFVTKPVVRAIEEAPIHGLQFSPGLSAFSAQRLRANPTLHWTSPAERSR
jgi:hypothetical protein